MSSHTDTPARGLSSIAARVGAAARNLSGRARGGRVAGHVDEISDGVLHGWAWRPEAPAARALVDVLVDDVFAGRTLAHVPRRDLAEAGLGDGRLGFELLIGEGRTLASGSVRAFALDAGKRVALLAPGSRAEVDPLSDAVAYLRATFATSLTPLSGGAPATAPTHHRRAAPLLATSADGVTAYAAHIAARAGTQPVEGRAETLRVYLQGYGRRRAPLRAPLSAADIAFLNAGPEDSAPLAPGRGQALLGRGAEGGDFEAAFRWAAYDSASLGVEDCLVPAHHRRALSACEEEGPFPLSAFLRRFLDGSPLQGLRGEKAGDRMIAWLALALFARAMPHLLDYVPAVWLDAFMRPAADGVAPFEAALAQILGASGYSAVHWRDDIARAGYDLQDHRFASFTAEGDRLWAAALPMREAPCVDVQLIGPFKRRLGISDSCRALAAALRLTGRSLRLCDYRLDHPNAARDVAELALEAPGPARVTILHLKLEDAPTALAYLPDVFSDTRLVVFPYLELAGVSAAQELGMQAVDEVWAASRFIADALAREKPTHFVGTACKPLRAIGRSAARRLAYGGAGVADEDFIFLTAGDAFSGVHRKNPLGAVAAFRAAFPDDADVRLVIKTHSRERVGSASEQAVWQAVVEAAEQDPRIALMDSLLDDDAMAALIEGADCLVSLHRAEGFGYHMLEAMQLGTPVVATAYSGNTDFCTPQTAFMVDFSLKPVAPDDYPGGGAGQSWAEPALASAIAALRSVRRDAPAREARIAAAKAMVARDYSLQALAARVGARLSGLLDGDA